MSKLIDLTGKRFGRLVVLQRFGTMLGQPTWLCQCDCGERAIVKGRYLRDGRTKSCGCFRSEKNSAMMKKVWEERKCRQSD